MAERKLVEGIMTYGLAYKPNLIPTSSFFLQITYVNSFWYFLVFWVLLYWMIEGNVVDLQLFIYVYMYITITFLYR
jgi:hypothetical protein